MPRKAIAGAIAGLMSLCVTSGLQAQPSVNAVITSDNAYAFGYGTVTGIPPSQYFGGIINLSAGDIYNCGPGPESYTIPGSATVGGYLYIIAWSDDATLQGTLGQFSTTGNPPTYTGVGNWEVYATGRDYDNTAPPLSQINAEIATANANAGPTPQSSGGWVGVTGGTLGNLAIGEDNTAGGTIGGVVCGIDPAARWMWFNADPSAIADPFDTNPPGNGGHKEFLIFRMPLTEVPGTGGCLEITEGNISCELTDAGPTGNYVYTFSITNLSNIPAHYVLLPNSGTSPNVISLPSPLAPGDTTQITVVLSGASPDQPFCFNVTLADETLNTCCTKQHCVELPDCKCLQTATHVECTPGAAPGTYTVHVSLTNLSSENVEHVFMIPSPPGSFTITPDYQNIPVLAPYQTTSLAPVQISGVTPGTQVCIRISLHSNHGEHESECCSKLVCVTVPHCEEKVAQAFGNLHNAQGQAFLKPQAGGELRAAELSASGEDGVNIHYGEVSRCSARWSTGSSVEDSQSLETVFYGFSNGQAYQILGSLKFSTSAGSAGAACEILADFASGSSAMRVQVVSAGEVVREEAIAVGTVGTASAWPAGAGSTAGPSKGLIAYFPAGTQLVVAGSTTTGDELRILPNPPGDEFQYLSDLTIRAAGFSSLDMISETSTVPETSAVGDWEAYGGRNADRELF